MSYDVYRVLEIGMPRGHQCLFVQTAEQGPDESGHIFHATGNIQAGMTFEHKPGVKEEGSATTENKTRVGKVALADYPMRFLQICETVEVPKKQFDGSRRLFPREPLRRCGEWVEDAIKALIGAGILED